MDPRWRPRQVDHNRRVRKVLAEGGRSIGTRFWGWEAVLMFYEIVIILDGYAEARGTPTPKSHKARRSVVERHLPHLLDTYDDLYTLSLDARYYDGYDMTANEGRRAAQSHGILTRSIPLH